MITEAGLDKFIKLFELKYGIKLNRQEALNMYIRLIRAVKITLSSKQNLKT